MSDQSGNCTGQHQKCLKNVRCPTVISCSGNVVIAHCMLVYGTSYQVKLVRKLWLKLLLPCMQADIMHVLYGETNKLAI